MPSPIPGAGLFWIHGQVRMVRLLRISRETAVGGHPAVKKCRERAGTGSWTRRHARFDRDDAMFLKMHAQRRKLDALGAVQED